MFFATAPAGHDADMIEPHGTSNTSDIGLTAVKGREK